MKKTKKILTLLVILILACNFFGFFSVYASTSNNTDLENKISKSIFEQLGKLDFRDLDKIISNLDNTFNIFNTNSNFKDIVKQIVEGKYFTSFNSVFSAIFNLVINGFVEILPLILTLVSICVLSVIITNLKSSSSSGVSDIIHFVCYAVVVLLLTTAFVQVMTVTKNALTTMKTLMEAVFPILLTLLTAIGALSSVAIYKPIVAILTSGVSVIFTNILYPIFILSFVFVVVGNLSNTLKLNKFNDLFSSLFKWITGLVLTIFSSFLVIQGISAGKFDSVSIKTTKFAVKSYIPIIGGFISDGFDFIVLSSVLIKNAVGVGVLVIIFGIVLVPVIKIALFKLSLQLVSAVTEPLGNSRITNFINSCAKILVYPIAIMIGVAFMFILTVALIMTTANIF